MPYDAGEAMIRVIPSLRGFVETIERAAEKAGMSAGRVFSDQFNRTVRSRTDGVNLGPSTQSATRQGQQTGRTFADSFKARVEAALRSLPDIQINADSTAAEVRIARLRTNLEQLRDQRVGIDISTEMALASLHNIRRQLDEVGASSADAAVRVDTAHASEELARIQAEIDALHGDDVRVNVDDGGTADQTARSVSALGIALVSLIPLAAPVGAALAGAFAGAASIAGVLGAAMGAIGLGAGDVPKATQLLDQRAAARQQQQSSAGSNSIQLARAHRGVADARYQADQQATTSAEQVQRARQSLADAQRSADRQAISDAQAVADAQRQSARQRVQDAQAVADAERRLGQADLAVTQAQQSLNAAREQAKRDLVDLRNAAKDANLSQKQAQIDLANAQANQDATNANWTSTAEQRRQAVLDVAKAHQALTEANLTSARATHDNNKAQAAGVSGQPGVISAQQQLSAAIQQQQQATVQLHRAQLQQRQDAQDSARVLVQAQTRQQQDAADSARSIRRAQQAVGDALREQASQARASREQILNAQESLQEAMRGTGAAGVNSLANIDSQLAKLPPSVVKFAKFWHNTMDPVIGRLKEQAASGLLPGIERGLKIMQPLFGPLGKFLHTIGQTLGTLFVQFAKQLTGPAWTRLFKLFAAEAPRWLMEFGHIAMNGLLGIVQLLQAFAPVTDMIGVGLVKITKAFADWTSGLSRNKAFQSFIEYIKTNGPVLMDALGKIVVIIGKLLVGLAPLGAVMLKVIDVVASFLATLNPDELLLIAAGIGAIITALGGPWMALAIAIVAVVGIIVRHWSSIVGFFKGIWAKVLGFFKAAWRDIKAWFNDSWHWVKNTFSTSWRKLLDILTWPIDKFRRGLRNAWDDIKGVFNDSWHWVRDTFSTSWHKILDILKWPLDHFTSGIDRLWGAIKTGFTKGIAGVKTAAKAAWGAIEKIFESPVYYVVKYAYQDGIKALWDATAAKIPGLKPMNDLSGFLDNLQHFAGGGVAPGYAPGRDSILAMLSPGEGILRPEVVRELGPETIHRWNRDRSVQHFSLGGVVGGVKDALLGRGGTELIDWVRSHWSQLTHVIGDLAGKVGDSPLGEAMLKLPLTLAKKIPGFIIDHLKSLAKSAFSIGDDGSGFHGQNPYAGINPSIGSTDFSSIGGSGGSGGYGARAVWNALTGGGLPAVQAAGIMGNIQSESDFNPWIIQGGGTSFHPGDAGGGGYGLVQWTPGAKLIPYLHGALPSVATEVAALFAQLSGRGPSPESYAGRALMAAATPADAATAFGLEYERYAGGVQGARSAQANYWYNKFAGGSKVSSGGPKAFDAGGLLEPGLTLAYNGTGQAELVAPRQTFDQVMGGVGGNGKFTGTLAITEGPGGGLYAIIDGRIDDRSGYDSAIGRNG